LSAAIVQGKLGFLSKLFLPTMGDALNAVVALTNWLRIYAVNLAAKSGGIMSTALKQLEREYGINPKDVPILDGEPWLTSNQLAMIARRDGSFSSIDVDFKEHVSGLNQVVWRATVIDKESRIFCRSGVATMGERLPTGAQASEHDLAASRALRSALAMAGFDVLKGGSAVSLTKPGRIEMVEDEATARYGQLRQIHTLAEKLRLIVPGGAGKPREMSQYKAFLLEHYGVESTAGMNESERASVIHALTQMEREYGEL
jgi:hypothetical protein